jgi:condensin complex subunit 1
MVLQFCLAQCSHLSVFLPLTEETSEVVDPSVDGSSEDKENMPECSDNISTGNCQTSTTSTGSEDGGEEIQSKQPARKGD